MALRKQQFGSRRNQARWLFDRVAPSSHPTKPARASDRLIEASAAPGLVGRHVCDVSNMIRAAVAASSLARPHRRGKLQLAVTALCRRDQVRLTVYRISGCVPKPAELCLPSWELWGSLLEPCCSGPCNRLVLAFAHAALPPVARSAPCRSAASSSLAHAISLKDSLSRGLNLTQTHSVSHSQPDSHPEFVLMNCAGASSGLQKPPSSSHL